VELVVLVVLEASGKQARGGGERGSGAVKRRSIKRAKGYIYGPLPYLRNGLHDDAAMWFLDLELFEYFVQLVT
jgi:hypothetical protein